VHQILLLPAHAPHEPGGAWAMGDCASAASAMQRART
jgi:hypothetical protein